MTNSTSHAASSSENKLHKVLEKPLIVGASVSRDYLSPSPGKVLALRYTKASEINVIAQNGTSGREVLKRVHESTVKDRSSIIGIDLFFWDTFSADPSESLKAIDKIVGLAKTNHIPIVIGEVPALVPFRQTSLTEINKKLEAACKSYSQCKLVPLNAILMKTLSDGYIVQGGKKHSLESLLPDGLHIAKPAGEFLADQIEKLL